VSVTDGAGGVIVAFTDDRPATAPDISAQRVLANGQLGAPVLSVPAAGPAAFALDPVRPNPLRAGALKVSFTLAGGAPARLEMLDVSGRRIIERDLSALGPGRHAVELGEHRGLAGGIYFLRLRQGGRVLTSRVAVLK
jgi:hypothetical protein